MTSYSAKASEYSSDVKVKKLDADLLICSCDDVIGPASKAAFPNAAAFKAVSYPGSGHALNFALNVTGAYEIIFGYLGKNNI